MATFILLPDGVTGTNDWLAKAGGACAGTNVDNDDDDTDYCAENFTTKEVTFTFANSSQSEIASITSVQIKFKARNTSDRNNFVYVSQTGTDISNGTDTITVAGTEDDTTHILYSGTAETTYDGSTAWNTDLTQINNLQVNLEKFRNSSMGKETRISYLYAEVTYVATTVGYTNEVIGIDNDDISRVSGIPTADISKVNGV
tara:strand:- start:17 stop:619 length:603 start_codon:yes stop_codon:yes gene_type:complete